MKFLLLLSVLLASVGAAPQVKDPLAKKLIELYKAEKPKTDADRYRVGCFASLCRFEDSDGCKDDCRRWAEVGPQMKNNMQMVEYAVAFRDATTKEECTNACVLMTSDIPKTEDLCSSYCRRTFSYPDRKEYQEAFVKARNENWNAIILDNYDKQ